jgi:hypothetical protein
MSDSAAMLPSADGIHNMAASVELCLTSSPSQDLVTTICLPDWEQAQEGTTLCSTWIALGYPLRRGVCAPAGSCYIQRIDWSASTIQVASGSPGGTTAAEPDDSDVRRWEYCRRAYVGPADIMLYSWARSIMTRDQCQIWAEGRTSSSRTLPQREAEAVLADVSRTWPALMADMSGTVRGT